MSSELDNKVWDEKMKFDTDCFCCGTEEDCGWWGEYCDYGHSDSWYCKKCYFGGGTVWGGQTFGPKYKVGTMFMYARDVVKKHGELYDVTTNPSSKWLKFNEKIIPKKMNK